MKQQLTKLEILWIRACRGEEPEKRLVSLYRRFYTRRSSKAEEWRAIVSILTDLCDKHFPIELSYLVIVHNCCWNSQKTFQEIAFDAIKSHIRNRVTNYTLQTTNFIPPKRFR